MYNNIYCITIIGKMKMGSGPILSVTELPTEMLCAETNSAWKISQNPTDFVRSEFRLYPISTTTINKKPAVMLVFCLLWDSLDFARNYFNN